MANRGVNPSAWYAGTAVVVVVVLAGSWFGFSSGKMSSAGLIREEVASAEHRNQILNTRVQALRADYAKLDEYKAEISALAVGIPSAPGLTSFVDVAAELADKHGVFIVDIQPVAPVAIVPDQAAPEEPPGDEPAAGSEDSTDETPAAPEEPIGQDDATAKPEQIIDGFAGLPIMFTVAGETPDVTTFLDKLQKLDRLFLPTIIRQERLDESGPTGGMPEIPEGWVQMDLTGYIFMFDHPFSEPVDSSLGEMPRKSDRNPFIPIEGGAGSGTDSEGDEGDSDDEDEA